MRQRNNKFASDVRAGKKAVHSSHQDKLAKRSPLSLWTLGLVVFVVLGGGTYILFTKAQSSCTDNIIVVVIFELIKIVFL